MTMSPRGLFFLGPGLRTAFALENANYFTVLRVEHFRGFLPHSSQGLTGFGSKLGKHFVLEIAIHCYHHAIERH
jgi:hypothetical protein